MSPKFNMVANYYITGMWSKKRVHDAVGKNWITAREYQQIVGEPYVN